MNLPWYTGSALKRELNFCNSYLSLLYFWLLFFAFICLWFYAVKCKEAKKNSTFFIRFLGGSMEGTSDYSFILPLVHCLLNSLNDFENKLILEYYTIAFKNNVTFKILQALFWLNYSEVQAISFDFHPIYQTGSSPAYMYFFSILVNYFLIFHLPLHRHSVHNAVSPGAKSQVSS